MLSAPNSARMSNRDKDRDNNESEDDEAGHGYRYDNVSSKSVGRAPTSGDRSRGRSKEPIRQSPPVVKKDSRDLKDIRDIRDNRDIREIREVKTGNTSSRDRDRNRDISPVDGNMSNSTIEDEEDEAKWTCLKCGDDNSNQYHCDSCATKRTAYSYAPAPENLRRQLPK